HLEPPVSPVLSVMPLERRERTLPAPAADSISTGEWPLAPGARRPSTSKVWYAGTGGRDNRTCDRAPRAGTQAPPCAATRRAVPHSRKATTTTDFGGRSNTSAS